MPVLDEARDVAEALDALAPLRRAGAEVIVVDGGSRDATREIAAPRADRVLVAPRGRAVQMNVGATVASGETLLFLHADCRLPADAATVIGSARARGARWGRFDVSLAGRSPMLPVIASMMNVRSRLTGIATGDQAMFVSREVFASLGGFPALPLMEDVAMSAALLAAAGRPACRRSRVIASGRRWDEHGAWRTIATMWALRFAYWRGADARHLVVRYYGRRADPPVTLQIFAKPPRPGRVKTRLAKSIGDDAAAALYVELLVRTLATARDAERAGVVDDVELWVAPGDDAGVLRELATTHGFTLREQAGEDLGSRMRTALRDALSRGSRAIVIGTDVPGYDVAYLAAAAAALQRHDIVVGPAEDGGYVLIGLARDVDVFSGVSWSTERVMRETRAILQASHASWQELATLWDVDTHADLERWQSASRGDAPARVAR